MGFLLGKEMRSVPSRGSVGSASPITQRCALGEADPTLPRDGTDLIPLRPHCVAGQSIVLWRVWTTCDPPDGSEALC